MELEDIIQELNDFRILGIPTNKTDKAILEAIQILTQLEKPAYKCPECMSYTKNEGQTLIKCWNCNQEFKTK